jgi:hypothetical protein
MTDRQPPTSSLSCQAASAPSKVIWPQPTAPAAVSIRSVRHRLDAYHPVRRAGPSARRADVPAPTVAEIPRRDPVCTANWVRVAAPAARVHRRPVRRAPAFPALVSNQDTARVDEHVAFDTVDFLGAVEPAQLGHRRRFDRTGVRNSGGGSVPAARPDADLAAPHRHLGPHADFDTCHRYPGRPAGPRRLPKMLHKAKRVAPRRRRQRSGSSSTSCLGRNPVTGSLCSRAAGWLNAPTAGSTAAPDSIGTTKSHSKPTKAFSFSAKSPCYAEDSTDPSCSTRFSAVARGGTRTPCRLARRPIRHAP